MGHVGLVVSLSGRSTPSLREIGNALAGEVPTSCPVEKSSTQKSIHSLIRNKLTHDKEVKLLFVHTSLKLLDGVNISRKTSTPLARLLQGTENAILQRRARARVGAVWMRRRKTDFLALPASALLRAQLVSGNTIVSAFAAGTMSVHGVNKRLA